VAAQLVASRALLSSKQLVINLFFSMSVPCNRAEVLMYLVIRGITQLHDGYFVILPLPIDNCFLSNPSPEIFHKLLYFHRHRIGTLATSHYVPPPPDFAKYVKVKTVK
jgi:hypothetical protein